MKINKIILALVLLNIFYIIFHILKLLFSPDFICNIELPQTKPMLHIVLILVVGYIIFKILSKQVAGIVAMAVLDKFGSMSLLLDKNLNLSKDEVVKIIEKLSSYDNAMVLLKFNYFVIIGFALFVLICNDDKIDIVKYVFMQSVLIFIVSLIVYFLSFKAKNNMGNS